MDAEINNILEPILSVIDEQIEESLIKMFQKPLVNALKDFGIRGRQQLEFFARLSEYQNDERKGGQR